MRLITLAALCSAGISTALAAPGAIHLVQKPAMNQTGIVFSYAGDLWRVGREGGAATRLTSRAGNLPGRVTRLCNCSRRTPSPTSQPNRTIVQWPPCASIISATHRF